MAFVSHKHQTDKEGGDDRVRQEDLLRLSCHVPMNGVKIAVQFST